MLIVTIRKKYQKTRLSQMIIKKMNSFQQVHKNTGFHEEYVSNNRNGNLTKKLSIDCHIVDESFKNV